MSKLLRFHSRGDTCFVTIVTLQRKPILIDNVDLIRKSTEHITRSDPSSILAWAILPNHIHMIIRPSTSDISTFMQRLKTSFAARYRKRHEMRNGSVWQRRFWDHIIRNQEDLNRHIDYIHYNPIKHGLVRSPLDWEHSSFQRFCELGYYQADWGVHKPMEFVGKFGE